MLWAEIGSGGPKAALPWFSAKAQGAGAVATTNEFVELITSVQTLEVGAP
jgi:hypothetical protein